MLGLATVLSTFEVEMGQIALSDSLHAALDPLLATVVEQTAADSGSEQQYSVSQTASDSTAHEAVRAGCSDPLPEVPSARTSRRAQRPSSKPDSTVALVAATSPAHLHARPYASSSLPNPFLKT